MFNENLTLRGECRFIKLFVFVLYFLFLFLFWDTHFRKSQGMWVQFTFYIFIYFFALYVFFTNKWEILSKIKISNVWGISCTSYLSALGSQARMVLFSNDMSFLLRFDPFLGSLWILSHIGKKYALTKLNPSFTGIQS